MAEPSPWALPLRWSDGLSFVDGEGGVGLIVSWLIRWVGLDCTES